MKVCISGYRDFYNYEYVAKSLYSIPISEVFVGDCRGTDQLVVKYCDIMKIPYRIFKADWNKYGISAGPIRNNTMLDEIPDLLIAFLSSKLKRNETNY